MDQGYIDVCWPAGPFRPLRQRYSRNYDLCSRVDDDPRLTEVNLRMILDGFGGVWTRGGDGMRSPLAWVGTTDSRLSSALASTATIVSIVMPLFALGAYMAGKNLDVPAAILAAYVCLLSLFLLALLIRQEGRFRREARYAAAMVPVRKAFNCLSDASWNLIETGCSPDQFRADLRRVLRFIAEAYSLITDSSCRSSIKVLSERSDGEHIEDIQVTTLCRNTEDEELDRTAPDRVGSNTDFRDIFIGRKAYFFSNDLPAHLARGYQNSHWDADTIRDGAFDYVATIVWPIGRSLKIGNETDRRIVVGFLCVDTIAKNVFNETYDVPLGAAFAQALNLVVHRYRSGQPNKRPEGNESDRERTS